MCRSTTTMRRAVRTMLLLLLSLLASTTSASTGKPCRSPPEHQNIGVSLSMSFSPGEMFSSGDTVFYECAEDFTTTGGQRYVKCLNGEWSKLTLTCEKDEATCAAPEVTHSKWRTSMPMHQVGDKISISCKKGFHLEGAQQITCDSNGEWQPSVPRCRRSSGEAARVRRGERGMCGPPPHVRFSNAHLEDKYISRTSFSSGDKVYYSCDFGHIWKDGQRSRTCNVGEWTPLTMKCELKPCGHAGEVRNGYFDYTGSQFGDTATAKCNEGYVLVGKATRKCMNEGWDGRVPYCEAVVCDEPQDTNAILIGQPRPPYVYSIALHYRCQAGEVLIGSRMIFCTASRTWNTSPPNCTETTCPAPIVSNSFWVGAHRRRFDPGYVISIICDSDYRTEGPDSITCGKDGHWRPRLPRCVPKGSVFA